MNKLTIETLKEIIGSYPEDSDEIECLMARQLLAYEQADKTTDLKTLVISEIVDFYAGFESPGEPETVDETQSQLIKRIEKVFGLAAPVLPKQPELIGMKVSIDTGSDNIGHRLFGEIVGTSDSNGVPVLCIEVAENNGDMAAPAQPVIPEQTERERIRREHAEWSDATFGNVGPVGPLKHLSKEALEAAADPDDLLELADMQFLLWDAQRRAGIPDDFITVAMIEKLEINKKRQWPEPKDGEPRLHINTQSAQPVSEPYKSAANDIIAERQRQISEEGWTPEHDDRYSCGELAGAAACYARYTNARGWVFPTNPSDYQSAEEPSDWPWAAEWWKPTNPRRDLVKAGALILAEIERLDRAAPAQESE